MRRMLYTSPFSAIEECQVIQALMQGIAKGTIKIAEEFKPWTFIHRLCFTEEFQ